jgi:hypothetical protein
LALAAERHQVKEQVVGQRLDAGLGVDGHVLASTQAMSEVAVVAVLDRTLPDDEVRTTVQLAAIFAVETT